jgi:hypothetical protein
LGSTTGLASNTLYASSSAGAPCIKRLLKNLEGEDSKF